MTDGLLYLSRADVEQVDLDMTTIIGLLDRAFREKAMGRVEMPPKPGIHPGGDNFIHAMPAYVPGMRAAGLKWIAGFPQNRRAGLPYISGLIVLNDVDTGLPYAVMDCTWITAYRTGAASALSARHLARPDSRVLGILGCGVQARTHLLALKTLFPIDRVLAYDTTRATSERFAAEMSEKVGVTIDSVDDPRKAVNGCDLVVTAGTIRKEPTPTIDRDWLAPGAFASAVDYDSYWTGAALAQIDKLATDDLPQLDNTRRVGYFKQTPQPYADLGELVAGLKPGRERDDERTMAMNLGLALDDMAVAPEIHRRAVARGIGTRLPL